MNLSHFSIKHKAVVIIIAVIAVIWGIINFQTVPRSEEPPFTARICTVSTYWPAHNAKKVENLVTEPLEDAISSVDNVDKIRSMTSPNLSVIYVEADRKLKGAAVNNLWDMIRAEIDKTDLPQAAEKPLVNTDFADTAAMMLAVYQIKDSERFSSQPDYSPRQIELMSEKIKDEIELVKGVADVKLSAAQEEVIYLETTAGTWSQLGMTVDEIQHLLQKRNVVATGGIVESEEIRYGVKTAGEFDTVKDIKNIVIGRNEEGVPVYLKDLGLDIRRAYREPVTALARYSRPEMKTGAQCVVVSFNVKDGSVVTDVTHRVRQKLEYLKQQTLPPDIAVADVADQGRVVEKRVDGFLMTLAQAVLVVILVAFLLIGLRIAAVMTAAIPLVIISSFGIVRFFDVQIEQISAVSFIIALGLLVDNTIEVCENIHRLLTEGCDRITATVHGVKQLAMPVFMATLTTVFAFLPMLTVPGDTGEFLYSLPVVVSTTLLVSWLVAMTVTALMAYKFLDRTAENPPVVRFRRLFRSLQRTAAIRQHDRNIMHGGYAALSRRLLRHKYLVIILTLVAFCGALFPVVSGIIGTQFFPAGRRTQFVVDITLPQESSLERTDKMVRRVEQIILDKSEIHGNQRLAGLVSFVGDSGPRIHVSVEPEPRAPNFARILVNTTGSSYTKKYAEEIRQETAKIAGCRVVPRLFVLGPPVESPIAIRIMGKNPDTLRKYAEQVKKSLHETGAAWDIHDSWGKPIKQLLVEPKKDVAKTAGVNRADISRTINALFSGRRLTTYREEDHKVPVVFRLRPRQWRKIRTVENIHIEGDYGKVPIGTVADVNIRAVPARIQHHRKTRCIEVTARPRGNRLANSVLGQISPMLNSIRADMGSGYRLEIGGEQEETLRSQKDLAFAFLIALLLILVCLVVQYNSLVKPSIILFTLPMAAIGAFPGLLITGQPLGFMAMLGLLSLAGVVLNDAIVYTTFADDLIRQKLDNKHTDEGGDKSCGGLSRDEFHSCLISAGQMRMLPIALTTLTTIGGLTPVFIFGGPLWMPLAAVVIFGLLVGTVLTLIVLPAAYAVLVETFKFKPVSGKDE